MIMSLVFLFLFYLSLFIVQALTVFVQKYTKKNSLNNKPIRTITEHLIEITNHKVQCSKHTLWSLTRRHTLVASKLCIWSCFVITAVIIIIFLYYFFSFFFVKLDNDQYIVPLLCVVSSEGRCSSVAPDSTRMSVGCWQCVCSCLVKSWSIWTFPRKQSGCTLWILAF